MNAQGSIYTRFPLWKNKVRRFQAWKGFLRKLCSSRPISNTWLKIGGMDGSVMALLGQISQKLLKGMYFILHSLLKMDRSFPLQIDKKLQSEKMGKNFRLNILVKFFNCSSAQCMKNDDKCLIWIFILFKVIIFPRQKIALNFEFWRQK